MRVARVASDPGAYPRKIVVEGLVLLAWLLPMTFAVLAHTDLKAISADDLALYRYTSDIVAYFRDGMPIAWRVQLGARYFPDLVISFAAYALSLGRAWAWGSIFALLNLCLVYGALRMLLRAGGVREAGRILGGTLFMAVLLLLTAISFQAGANLLRTTFHNTLIAPALVFCSLPLLASRADRSLPSTAFVAGFGILFGLVIHSDPLFLPWSVAPTLATALLMAALGGIKWRGLTAAVAVALAALLLAQALRLGFAALPFLAYRDDRVFSFRLGHLDANLLQLGQAYAGYGTTNVLLLYALALAGGALSLWITLPEPGEVRHFRLYVFVLFAATVLAVPAAMATKDLLSLRYLFWGIAVAALPITLGIADTLGRLRASSAAAGLVAVALVVATPFFMARARDAAARKTAMEALVTALDAEAASGRIGRTGLSSYWVAHKASLFTDLTITPLAKDARPLLLAGNGFAFWDWRSGCPQRRHFTFVVTARKGAQRLRPAALEAQFGPPAKVVPVAGTAFEIWRYPDGIPEPDELYRDLTDRLVSKGISTRALDRCAGSGGS